MKPKNNRLIVQQEIELLEGLIYTLEHNRDYNPEVFSSDDETHLDDLHNRLHHLKY